VRTQLDLWIVPEIHRLNSLQPRSNFAIVLT
jgi:hypothetical protein